MGCSLVVRQGLILANCANTGFSVELPDCDGMSLVPKSKRRPRHESMSASGTGLAGAFALHDRAPWAPLAPLLREGKEAVFQVHACGPLARQGLAFPRLLP